MMKRTLQQIAAHSMEEQNNLHLLSNKWFTTAHLIPSRMPPMTKKKKIPNSPIRWWQLARRTSSGQALLHPWTVTTTWPVPLPLPIQLGSATPHSRKSTNSTLHMMDLSNIFNFQDVMTVSSNEDIPNLDDVFEFEYSLNKLYLLKLSTHEIGWTCLVTLITCVIIDTCELYMHHCYLNIHKLRTFINDAHYKHLSLNIYIHRTLYECL